MSLDPKKMTRAFVASLFAGQLLFSFILLPVLGKNEVYPFFKWSLYSAISQRVTDFELHLVQLNGHDLKPPCDLLRCPIIRLRPPKDTFPYALIQEFGKAHTEGRPIANALLKDIESYILQNPTSYRVHLVLRKYSPQEFLKNDGSSRREEVAIVAK